MAHKPEVWLEVKARYEAGEKVRELGRKFNMPHSGIVTKAQKEGWIQGKNDHLMTKLIEIDRRLKDGSKTKEESKYIDKIVSERVQISERLHSLSKGVLTVTGRALKTADNQQNASPNCLDIAGKAIFIAKNANDNILKQAELYSFKPMADNSSTKTNNTFNNNNTMDIAQLYQEMINAI